MFSKLILTLVVSLLVCAQQWKDTDEYNVFQSIAKTAQGGDFNATLAGLDRWKSKYPASEYAQVRLDLYVVTYTQLKRPRDVIDTAREILKNSPDRQIALAAILDSIYQLPKSPGDLDTAAQAATRIIDRADSVYARENRPRDMNDDAAQKAKLAIQPFAHRTLGWIFLQRGDNEKAAAELSRTLELDSNDVKASAMLGQAYASEKKTELRPLVIFHYARAAEYAGPGAFDESNRKTMLDYARSQYKNYTGSQDGFDRVLDAAKSAALPCPAFHIRSAEEIAEEKLKAQQAADIANPMLALWRDIRLALEKENGAEYFDASMKDALLPGGVNGVQQFRGKVVAVHPANRAKRQKMELIVAVENGAGDAILRLEAPGPFETGQEISFEGVARSFTKDPFTIVFEVERSKASRSQ